MKTTIQETPAWVLSAQVQRSKHGNLLQFASLVPTARRPEEQVAYQVLLSDAELNILQKVLSDAVASATI